MTLVKKIKWLSVVMLAGLLLTHCGHESGMDSGYKADNAIVDDNNDPATTSNTAGSPAEMNVGDVYAITLDSDGNGEISFEGVDSSAEFVLAVTSLDAAQGTHSVQLSDENASPDISKNVSTEDAEDNYEETWNGWSTAEGLDQQLRAAESEIANDPSAEIAAPANISAGLSKGFKSSSSPEAGDVESFKVLSGLSSLTSYKTVQATAKCVGKNVVFYVDKQVDTFNPQDLTTNDVQSLCSEFDVTLEKEFEIFGEPSDVNGDGKVAVLFTPQVNRLGAMGGGIITGFFFANDLYLNANSNHREIVYIMVPDSAGKYGMTIPKQFAMDNLLPAVLPHEVQHAINYNQKVFVNKGRSEDGWLNEGLSHLAEDILGHGQENPSRVDVYLNDPASYGIANSGSPGLAERGGIYLFLRYMYEQTADGNAFVWNLLHSPVSGIANVELSFAGAEKDFDQFSEFMLRWTSAMIMSSFNLSTDPKFSYEQRLYNEETGQWEGVCLSCDTEDGRGTVLNGIPLNKFYSVTPAQMKSMASEFYLMTSFPRTMNLTARVDGIYGATLVRFK